MLNNAMLGLSKYCNFVVFCQATKPVRLIELALLSKFPERSATRDPATILVVSNPIVIAPGAATRNRNPHLDRDPVTWTVTGIPFSVTLIMAGLKFVTISLKTTLTLTN
jgi:hypothetical protein